mmetsp:Transcript_45729/g.109046  ORF Transcript_45729/g.109046 Transcript_45729/m.109046 type:complete len:508 (+) Transcript_45729:224-1747(+)
MRRIALTPRRSTGCMSPGASANCRSSMTTSSGAPLLITWARISGVESRATAENMKHAASATSASRAWARMTMTKADIKSPTSAMAGVTLRSHVHAIATLADTATATSPGRARSALISPIIAFRHPACTSSSWVSRGARPSLARDARTVHAGITTAGWFQSCPSAAPTSASPSPSGTWYPPSGSPSASSHILATRSNPRATVAGRGEECRTTAPTRERAPPSAMMAVRFRRWLASASIARKTWARAWGSWRASVIARPAAATASTASNPSSSRARSGGRIAAMVATALEALRTTEGSPLCILRAASTAWIGASGGNVGFAGGGAVGSVASGGVHRLSSAEQPIAWTSGPPVWSFMIVRTASTAPLAASSARSLGAWAMLVTRKRSSRRSSESFGPCARSTCIATAAPWFAAMFARPSSVEATFPRRKHAASITRVCAMLELMTRRTASTPRSCTNCCELLGSWRRFPRVSHATPCSVGFASWRCTARSTRETAEAPAIFCWFAWRCAR